jgi:hypothetical protein
VVNRAHIDSVVDVGDEAKLETSLDHTPEEVVSVGDSRDSVTKDVTRAENVAGKTATTGLHDDLLSDPLGLAVTSVKTGSSVLEVVGLRETSLAGLKGIVRLADKGLVIQDGSRRDEAEELGLDGGTELKTSHGREDVGSAHLGVGVDPVNDGTVVENSVGLAGNAVPVGLRKTEALVGEVTNNSLDAAVGDPSLVPDATADTTVAKTLETLLGGLGAHKTDHLANTAREKILEDEGTKETGTTSKEDGEAFGGEVGWERGKLLGQLSRERSNVGGVVDLLGSHLGRAVGGDYTAARKVVNGSSLGLDSGLLEDKAKRGVDNERLADLEDETGSEDRVAAEVEEVLVDTN